MTQARMRRYPGLNYFTTEQKAQFFGRDDEKAALLALVLTEKIVALFGKSGYGKSSLLRAGLIPELPEEFIPIIIQFGAYQPDPEIPAEILGDKYFYEEWLAGRIKFNSTLVEKIQAALYLVLPNDTIDMNFLDNISSEDSLWKRFKKKQSAIKRTFLLIFDQFEEFQTYPTKQREDFKKQVAELLFTRIPQAVRDRSDELPDVQQDLLARPNEVRAVFAIREDRLSVLDSLADKLPAILHKRFHLKGLDDRQATAAIVQPALLPQGERFESPVFHYAPVAVEAIKKGLKKDEQEPTIESFLLQICCEEIEHTVIKRGISGTELAITERDLPVFEELFEQYYRNKIAALPTEAQRNAARRMIEDHLVKIDPSSGIAYRINADGRALCTLDGVDEALLKRLTDFFLLRSEPNTTGGFSYEVSHDRLVEGILVMRKEWEAEEAERQAKEIAATEELRKEKERLDAEARALEAEERAQYEAKLRRKAQVEQRRATFATFVIIGLAIWAFWLLKQARESELEIKQALDNLTKKEGELTTALAIATSAKDTAEIRQIEAAAAKNRANKLQLRAEYERQKAVAALQKLKTETVKETQVFDDAVKKWENGNRHTLQPGEWKTKVDTLDLREKELSTLPEQVYECENLEVLNLSNNLGLLCEDVFPKLGKLKNLTTLNLGYNQLITLPAQIGELKNLTTLNLTSNELIALPAQIGELKNLTTLNLMFNNLTALPAQIGELKNLTTLNLGHNELIALPAQIEKLKNLTTLNLEYNELIALPAQIGKLQNLQSLDLNSSQLSSLPIEIAQLQNLKSLDLNNNRLSSLSVEIAQLQNLKSLNLNNNRLSSLPVEIVQLQNLQTLELGRNEFSSLPAEILQLQNLKYLDLHENQLNKFSTEIVKLQNLESLDISDNPLSSLPIEVLKQMPNLKKIFLKGVRYVDSLKSEDIEALRHAMPWCEIVWD